MNWDLLDFTVFGIMLLGVGVIFATAKRKTDNATYLFAVGFALASAFILIWVNGAVGVIGTADNGANMLFFVVLAVAVIGGVIVRFQPLGMARVLYATALAQGVVAVIALLGSLGSTAPGWPRDILTLSAFFIALWLLSAWLFRKAARGKLSVEQEPEV
jgi:hypothetical protein